MKEKCTILMVSPRRTRSKGSGLSSGHAESVACYGGPAGKLYEQSKNAPINYGARLDEDVDEINGKWVGRAELS